MSGMLSRSSGSIIEALRGVGTNGKLSMSGSGLGRRPCVCYQQTLGTPYDITARFGFGRASSPQVNPEFEKVFRDE